MKAMQTQINIMKNELRNEIKNSIQASMSNQTNEIKNMMASLFQMNTASTSGSGSLPSNTFANLKGKLKSITTRSGIFLDGPSVPTPPPFINPGEDERPSSQRDFVMHQRDPLHPNIPYPSMMLKQKQQEKDEVQIYKFWQMFKQLHINITLADALILMPKYQKMLKALPSNKEKLQELANTPLNENCSAKLGLPELILTRMTLELANRAICTPSGIARDVFVPVGKFTFLADFVIVDYESDPRVPLILRRPFLQTARALIDVHGEEMILFRSQRDRISALHDPIKDIDSSLKDSIDQSNLAGLNDNLVDFMPKMFTDEHALDYSSPPIFDEYDDDLLEVKSDTENVYDDPFDSKGEKIKESKLLIDELDHLCDFLLPSEYDLILSEDFSRVDA
nr:hypothetical protein [Tanacetum cinerariifolium]